MSLVAALAAALAVLLAGGVPGRAAPRSRPATSRSPATAVRAPRRRRRRPAAPSTGDLAVLLDLVAAVLSSGAGPAHALDLVATALDDRADQSSAAAAAVLRAVRAQLDVGPTASAVTPAVPLAPGALGAAAATLSSALRLAAAAGVPPAALVRAAAADLRRERAAARARAAARLGVLLVLPGGLCLLPAFMALGVAPLVIDLLHHAGL